MRTNRPYLVLSLLLGSLLPAQARSEEPFFLRDGDRVVAIGDSITVGGYYARYLENFVRTRHPTWNVTFRNCGINGHTALLGFQYLDDDVLVWKPTVALVVWGMNDGRAGDGVERYKRGIVPYVDKLLANNVRVVLCSNSPLDRGDEPGKFTNFNQNFHEMANFAKDFAKERGIPFVDMFHFCHTLWGENRQRKNPVPVSAQTLAKHPSDDVHAWRPGQMTMFYLLAKTLHAPAEVSFAAIDAKSGLAETRRCAITAFTHENGRIAFVRTDEASPCFIENDGARALDLVPFQDEFNRMILKVAGLEDRNYDLEIDDMAHGQFSAKELADGINLSLNRASPIYAVGKELDRGIDAQCALTYGPRDNMRWQPPAWLKVPNLRQQKESQFAAVLPQVEKNDQALAAAAKPRPHRYELQPVRQSGRALP